jgi:hypothetical protein
MIVAISSLALLVTAVVLSRVALVRLAAAGTSRDPHAYWALGLATLVPAWVVAFLGLLGTQPGARPHMISTAAWVLSAAAALIGAISTEALVRAAGDSVEAQDAPRLWRLGLFALLPAVGVALLGQAAPR